MLDQIVGYMFETGLEIAVNNLPHVLRQTVAKVVAKKGTDLYYTIRGQKTDREILVELNGKINSLGTSSEAMEAIAVIKQYTESFNESFKQNAQIYEEISGLNERLRSGALENQLKLQLTDVLNEILSHYGVKLDKIDGLVRKSTSELHIRFDDVEEMLQRFGGDLGDIRDGVNDANEKLDDLLGRLNRTESVEEEISPFSFRNNQSEDYLPPLPSCQSSRDSLKFPRLPQLLSFDESELQEGHSKFDQLDKKVDDITKKLDSLSSLAKPNLETKVESEKEKEEKFIGEIDKILWDMKSKLRDFEYSLKRVKEEINSQMPKKSIERDIARLINDANEAVELYKKLHIQYNKFIPNIQRYLHRIEEWFKKRIDTTTNAYSVVSNFDRVEGGMVSLAIMIEGYDEKIKEKFWKIRDDFY